MLFSVVHLWVIIDRAAIRTSRDVATSIIEVSLWTVIICDGQNTTFTWEFATCVLWALAKQAETGPQGNGCIIMNQQCARLAYGSESADPRTSATVALASKLIARECVHPRQTHRSSTFALGTKFSDDESRHPRTSTPQLLSVSVADASYPGLLESVQPMIMQEPSSRIAALSKFSARGFVQPYLRTSESDDQTCSSKRGAWPSFGARRP